MIWEAHKPREGNGQTDFGRLYDLLKENKNGASGR